MNRIRDLGVKSLQTNEANKAEDLVTFNLLFLIISKPAIHIFSNRVIKLLPIDLKPTLLTGPSCEFQSNQFKFQHSYYLSSEFLNLDLTDIPWL